MTLNDQFKNMTPAQKSFVLSMLVNKVLQNPKDYGLDEDGIIKVGDDLDFTKLFENTREINSIFLKARETITVGSSQEKLILENNEKIAEWVKNNPKATLTSGKVPEILNSKPKLVLEPDMKAENIEVPKRSEPEILSEETSKIIKEQIQNEITEAKQRLEVLEGGKNSGEVRSMMGDISSAQGLELAVRNGINDIYGEGGFMGFGKVIGINSREWGEMARLPANKIVEYYTGDSAKSGLASDIVERLAKSNKHSAFMKQIVGLMEQSNGAVKPFENESVDQFMRRLVGYSLRTQTQNLQKAA